mgnify:CR=1 FL=1
MTVVCLDDAPDQLMADHVPGVEMGECYVVDAAQNASMVARPDRGTARSTCVTSPVMIIVVLNPRRVRNIFICCSVVFCASSRIT